MVAPAAALPAAMPPLHLPLFPYIYLSHPISPMESPPLPNSWYLRSETNPDPVESNALLLPHGRRLESDPIPVSTTMVGSRPLLTEPDGLLLLLLHFLKLHHRSPSSSSSSSLNLFLLLGCHLWMAACRLHRQAPLPHSLALPPALAAAAATAFSWPKRGRERVKR